MIIIALVTVLVACIYGMWRLLGRSPGPNLGQSGLWRIALAIAVVRIGAVWIAVFGFRSPGWFQIPAYFAGIFGLPEIYLIRSVRHEPLLWAWQATALLAGTSLPWAALACWVVRRLLPVK